MVSYDKYKYKPYDPVYPKLFKKEENKLKKILPRSARIEHIGSTAVEGLGGKGIVDILIFVGKKQVLKCLRQLVEIGFEYKPEHIENKKRKFFQKRILNKGLERRVHIHLTADNGFFNSFVAFRDYLRNNKKATEEYAKIKKRGSKLALGDKLKYAEYKSSFLKQTIEKALNEKE